MIIRLLFLILAAALLHTGPAQAAGDLPVLTRTGPWLYAARPVGFQGRIWFVNANRWPDHNSADIWSVLPDGTGIRPERRLFSQDLGEPLIRDGLIYWPLEDPRVSLGWGQIAVTDGQHWRMLETRTGRQFHLHGLFANGESILAAGSSSFGQILRSDDGGLNWSVLFEAEREESRFSRTYFAVPTPAGLFGDLMTFGDGERRFTMLQHHDFGAQQLADWPVDGWVRRALPWRGGGVALSGLGKKQQICFFGTEAEPVALPDGVIGIDLAVDNDGGLWLLGKTEPRRHRIWRLIDGQWSPHAAFNADEAVELRLIGGRPVVAGSDGGQGTLWGRPGTPESMPQAPLPRQITQTDADPDAAFGEIAVALSDPAGYRGHGLILRNLLDRWIMRGLPGSELEPLLAGTFPEGDVRLIGGRANASHQRFGRWLLAWAMRRSGSGRVPAAWLSQAFDEPDNVSEKYFSEPLAAIWTVAANGGGAAEKAALEKRLTTSGDPDWLRADAEEALRRLPSR